jgi:hypothetical protein
MQDRVPVRRISAGLLGVMRWVRQWHNEVDERYGISPAETYAQYLASQRDRYNLIDEDLGANPNEHRPSYLVSIKSNCFIKRAA